MLALALVVVVTARVGARSLTCAIEEGTKPAWHVFFACTRSAPRDLFLPVVSLSLSLMCEVSGVRSCYCGMYTVT